MKITNNNDTPLSLAVWLVHDEYDYINEPNYISVTKLMKPIRHIVLPPRVPVAERTADVDDFISRALGHSLHDSIEKAWVKGHRRNLAKLGYPESVINRVMVNPTDSDIAVFKAKSGVDPIPVYLEQRAVRKINVRGIDFLIGGKFDMVAEGIVHDNKSTTAYTWVHGTRDEDYKIQGSLYRWLNPDKITADFIRICFIFTDWQKAMAKADPKYPQKRLQYKDVPLMSLEETEAWVIDKLNKVLENQDKEEPDVVPCTPDELWMSDPVYKYYADPNKTSGRSTKNFDNIKEAKIFMADKLGKGILKTFPGEAKRCGYCDAYPVCTQKEKPDYA